MNVKLLRQFGQRLLTPYGSQGHLRFESRRVVPAWSSAHRFSCSAAILAAVRQKLHLSNLFKNPEPALTVRIWRSVGDLCAVFQHVRTERWGWGWAVMFVSDQMPLPKLTRLSRPN